MLFDLIFIADDCYTSEKKGQFIPFQQHKGRCWKNANNPIFEKQTNYIGCKGMYKLRFYILLYYMK